MIHFERKINPENRTAFLQQWLFHPHFKTKVLVKDGDIRGYFTLRPTSGGEWRLGSFFASTLPDAEQLFQTALHYCEGQGLYIDMPETNPNAQILTRDFDGQLIFESIRMYKGYSLKIDHSKLYGIAYLETG